MTVNAAVISNNKVSNIIVVLHGSQIPNIVELGDIPAAIGDDYINGKFYRDGIEVTPAVADIQAVVTYEQLATAYGKGVQEA